MNHKKNIIIVGYPKSGTNWLSRLVADVMQCDFKGDWGFKTYNASGIKNNNELSDHQVYKSHHISSEIYNVSDKNIYKIIYLIRDPRDIVISGAHFFNFYSRRNAILKKFHLNFLIRNPSFEKRKKEMIQAILYGNKKITSWFKVPWKNHFEPYINKDVLFIKYEDLITTPENELKKILQYLETEINQNQIEKSIKNQSFEKRQKEVLIQNHKNLIKLVRKGSSGYWKNELTKQEKQLFHTELKEFNRHYNF